MATVTAYIRTSAKKTDKVYVRFRVSDGKIQLYHKSKIEVDPNNWDPKKQEIKAKIVFDSAERTKFNGDVADRKKLIRKIYDSSPGLTSDLLDLKIDQEIHPEKYIQEKEPSHTYFEIFDRFLAQHKVSEGRRNHFKVLKRALRRYELYRGIKLHIDTITKDTVRDIEYFLKDEPSVFKKHPEIYKLIPECRTPQPRGINTLSGILSRYRTFCLWLVKEKLTQNNPFEGYAIDGEIYGTPFYLTIDERNTLYNHDLSDRPELAVQRDIFIFHCLVGWKIRSKLTPLRQSKMPPSARAN